MEEQELAVCIRSNSKLVEVDKIHLNSSPLRITLPDSLHQLKVLEHNYLKEEIIDLLLKNMIKEYLIFYFHYLE